MEDQGRMAQLLQGNLSKLLLSVGLSSAAVGVYVFLRRFGIIYQLFHKVEKDSKRHGGELVAEVLKAHGVKNIFTLVGGHISPILVACEKLGIRVVDTRHEVTAVFAADAVARMSGTVGVAAVTAGPGLTNTVTAVKNAQMAESPVLLMGGAAASILKGRGALQDIDQMSLFKPLCKYCATVTKVRDIVPTLKTAMQIAQSGTPGPVFVEFPIDSLYPYQMVNKEVGAKSKAKGLVTKIVNWYLQNYVDDLFAGAWEKRDTTPLPVSQPKATDAQVQKSIELLSRAKKPLILLGSQATLPPVPVDKLRKAVESMGIPCFLGGMARGLLGQYSELQIRQKRGEALKDADVVVLAGAVCDFRLGYGRTLNRKSKIIAVNRNKEQLLKLLACYGVMGGFMQPQGHVQVLLNMLEFGMDPQRALDMPRFCVGHGHVVSANSLEHVYLEQGIPEDVVSTLQAMGHNVTPHVKGFGRSVFGRGQIIARGNWPFIPLESQGDSVYWAGSDPRADGAAVGY